MLLNQKPCFQKGFDPGNSDNVRSKDYRSFTLPNFIYLYIFGEYFKYRIARVKSHPKFNKGGPLDRYLVPELFEIRYHQQVAVSRLSQINLWNSLTL